MRRTSSQLSIAGVAVILGILLVLQLRSQTAGPGLDALSAQELTDLVGNLNTRNDLLRTERAQLQVEAQQLSAAEARGETSLGQLNTDLGRIEGWTGVRSVTGAGIRVTITGPVPGVVVEDLLNELRNGGAEALSVANVRLVAGSVVAGNAGAISVENTPLGNTFEVAAIGNSASLTGLLTRAGGMIAQLRATLPDVEVIVTPVERIDMPPTTRALTPSHGTPHL